MIRSRYSKIISVEGEKGDGARFRAIKFHPSKPEFTVILNDEAAIIVDLTKLEEGSFIGSEKEFFSHQCVNVVVQPMNSTRSVSFHSYCKYSGTD